MSNRQVADRNGLELEHPGIKCHIAKRTWMLWQLTYLFSGHLRKSLWHIGNRMLESGVLLMIERYSDYILTLETSSLLKKKATQEEKSRALPFQMNDSKILSIFIGWAFLVGVSLLVFALELSYPNLADHIKHSSIVFRNFIVCVRGAGKRVATILVWLLRYRIQNNRDLFCCTNERINI